MTVWITALCKAAGLFSLAYILGGGVFLWLSGVSHETAIQEWKRRITAVIPYAVTVLAAASVTGLLAQIALTAQIGWAEFFSNLELLQSFLLDTRAGKISVLRLASILPLWLACLVHTRAGNRKISGGRSIAVLFLAAITAGLGPFTGHTAGDENAIWLIPVHILHVLAIIVWLGGLPAWISLIIACGRAPGLETRRYAGQALTRFSKLAMLCMAIIAITGIILSLNFITSQGELLGTAYGWLICGKLLLLLGVLAIANHIRLRYLPRLGDVAEAEQFHSRAAQWVGLELLLAAVILTLGGELSQTTPALHDNPRWFLPFRLSLAATWPVPPTPLAVSLCMALFAFSGAMLVFNYKKLSLLQHGLAGGAIAMSLGLTAWFISVPAYPDTYRRSGTPYITLSIARGMAQYAPLCNQCHGPGGLGNGALAASLPKPPADLSAPHTALHTSGDMFWWLSHGIPESGMPDFADALLEQDRWDMINFLRAFSQGFEARLLSPNIAPRRPWLGAPNFYYESESGEPLSLRDFLERINVLLVFSSDENSESAARLRNLRNGQQNLMEAKVLLLPVSDPETRRSYELLSRTLANRGDARNIAFPRQHMEFLIDRFGYIRARWIPEDDASGWQDIAAILGEAAKLNAEPRILPPPSEHVH